MTLPPIHLLQQGEDRAEKIVRDIIAARDATEEQWAEIMDMLRAHRSIDYAYQQAVDYAERAKKALYVFPASSERDALLALPDYVLARDR
jgi:octaprenyl-diphosphate synthase